MVVADISWLVHSPIFILTERGLEPATRRGTGAVVSPQGLIGVKLLCDNRGHKNNLALFGGCLRKKLTHALWLLLAALHSLHCSCFAYYAIFIEYLLHARYHAMQCGEGRGVTGAKQDKALLPENS